MKMLSFAAVIATMAIASHAEPTEGFLQTLSTVSGPRDGTALISRSGPGDYVPSECTDLLSELNPEYFNPSLLLPLDHPVSSPAAVNGTSNA